MSKLLVYFFTVVILLALNAVFPHVGASAPNFLFLLVVIFAFRQDGYEYLWLAFFAGLLLDVYSGTFFGTYMLSFLFLALIINYTTRTFFSADPSVNYIAVVVAVSYLTLVGLIYLMNSIGVRIDGNFSPISAIYLNNKIWLDLLLNLVFAAPIYYVALLDERLLLKLSKNHNL